MKKITLQYLGNMVFVGLAKCSTWFKTVLLGSKIWLSFLHDNLRCVNNVLFNQIYPKQDIDDTKTQEVTGRESIREQKHYY